MFHLPAPNFILLSHFHSARHETDPAKVQALQDLPTPHNPKQLQSFLGLINYLQSFLPGLASKTTFLREQVTNWDWNPSTDQSFHCLNSWICNTLLKTILAYYDRTQPLVLQTNASEYGLSVALLQNNRPIAFASKTLTDVETRYANIERECLSVCYGLEKFHTCIYGKHITVQNNHKLLEMIQRKPIHTAPPRLQCMLLHLQKYNYTIQYIPGQNMVLADRLSRFPSPHDKLPIEFYQNIHALNFHPDRLLIIQGVIECNPIHSAVYRMTLNGCPNRILDVPCLAHHFWSLRDELTIKDGVLLKGNRVCIPPELHDRTPYDLHDSHQGIEIMTNIARANVYCPGIDADIADYVRRCTICTKHKASQTVQPLLLHDIPDGPWQEIAADYFTHKGKDYLLIADTFSKYPFIFKTHSKAADSIINHLQDLFSQFGTPKHFFSQTMALPFHQSPFCNFCHPMQLTTSPHHPYTPGQMVL